MLKNLSSTTIVIGALRVKFYNTQDQESFMFDFGELILLAV